MGVLTYDMSGHTDVARWAHAVGMDPQAMTIEQACAAMNAIQDGAVYTVLPSGRGLHLHHPVVESPGTITLVSREPNPLRHNPLTPDPADAEVRPC